MAEKQRCEWGNGWGSIGREMTEYHDKEWGKPVHDDRKLFEMLVLEGFQAGLNWMIILNKRKNFQRAFDNFDYKKVARYDEKKVRKLLKDKGIIRNRLKIKAAIGNARAFLKVQEEFGSFDKYIWQFSGGKPIRNKWKSLKNLPAKTSVSDKMSEDLRKRGFRFVGSTICYAFMQAVGIVNDHTVNCFRYKDL